MKVIFTCGGTAGHVNPALALAGYMREKDAGTQILFVGAERGLERDLIAHTDYPFRTVNISSFHRSFRPAEIKHNLIIYLKFTCVPHRSFVIFKFWNL